MDAVSDDEIARAARLTTCEVLALLRLSRATLWRRIAAGRFPAPVDRGRQALFSRAAVLTALNAGDQTPHSLTVAIEQRLDALSRRRRKCP